MLKLIKICSKFSIVFFCFVCITLMGCKGTDTREDIDDTVEELAGKKNIDRMEKMKGDIGKIKEQQTDRLEEFDENQQHLFYVESQTFTLFYL